MFSVVYNNIQKITNISIKKPIILISISNKYLDKPIYLDNRHLYRRVGPCINYGTAQLQGKTRVSRSRVLLASFSRVASRLALRVVCLLADNFKCIVLHYSYKVLYVVDYNITFVDMTITLPESQPAT